MLIDLCRRLLQPDSEVSALPELTEDQWGRLLYLAAYHRVGPILGSFARSLNAPRHVVTLLETYYLYNRERTWLYAQEIASITKTMAAHDLDVLVRKGGYLAYSIYPEAALREFNDLDLLIHESDRERASEILVEMGYAQGVLTTDARAVKPLARRTEVFWRLNASSLPVFIRPAANDYVNHYRVDLRFGLLEPVTGKSLPMEDWFTEAQTVHAYGISSRVASREHFLIDVAVHLYREAIALTSIEANKDLRLMRFLDMAAMFVSTDSRPDVARLGSLVETYDLCREVYYALHFTDLLFPSIIPQELITRLRPADTNYLEQYGEIDHAKATWPMDFITRLFDPSRSRFVQSRSELPR
ncbi:nucleotidyltransferase family protein [Streptomyces fildesensis]|uniref:nucleotidyltransferase family protein n=1 Tax=Streptomyces fildesensis TaxID=375757 RepID=UPI0018DF85DB|nr:nucleotidyltransferase family protein [Streptomyces fildesensis]